jgi:hypothetical protein
MTDIRTMRRRLEMQGYHSLDDETLRELGPWFRWAPSICAITMTIGLVLGSPEVLWSMGATAFLTAFLPVHPFDLLYNHGVRYFTSTPPLPRTSLQRRMVCAMASVWLLLTGLAFQFGATSLGLVLGVPLTAVTALVSATHICLPSAVCNWLLEGDRHRSAFDSPNTPSIRRPSTGTRPAR